MSLLRCPRRPADASWRSTALRGPRPPCGRRCWRAADRHSTVAGRRARCRAICPWSHTATTWQSRQAALAAGCILPSRPCPCPRRPSRSESGERPPPAQRPRQVDAAAVLSLRAAIFCTPQSLLCLTYRRRGPSQRSCCLHREPPRTTRSETTWPGPARAAPAPIRLRRSLRGCPPLPGSACRRRRLSRGPAGSTRPGWLSASWTRSRLPQSRLAASRGPRRSCCSRKRCCPAWVRRRWMSCGRPCCRRPTAMLPRNRRRPWRPSPLHQLGERQLLEGLRAWAWTRRMP